MEGENGEAGGGHDSICPVSGCTAGLRFTVNVYCIVYQVLIIMPCRTLYLLLYVSILDYV